MSYSFPERPKKIEIADDPEQEALDRIATVSQQAKAAWFGLLAALVFVTVTLMGHEDADFFAYGAATTLPVVGLDVPPEAFFLAAPVLITALYVYLHLYLLNLWEALSEAPPVIRGKPLAKRAYPTMITAWALRHRDRKRRDGCSPPRAMGWLNSVASLLLVWVATWGVMAGLWWLSMPVHDPWLTYPLGALLFVPIAVGVRSYASAQRKLSGSPESTSWLRFVWRTAWRVPVLAALVFTSFVRIGGYGLPEEYWGYMARANLTEKHLTVRPADFREHAEWMEDFEAEFRRREGIAPGADMTLGQQKRYYRDAKIRRTAELKGLSRRSLQGHDLRRANVFRAFMVGIDLRNAKLDRAFIGQSNLEGADFTESNLMAANLHGSQLINSVFFGAEMFRTFLYGANLTGADLRDVRLISAQLEFVIFDGADMRSASFRSSTFEKASLVNSNLWGSSLEKANFRNAVLDHANLFGAKLMGINAEGWSVVKASLRSADLSEAWQLDERSIHFAFGDEGTKLPTGVSPPCHWNGIGHIPFEEYVHQNLAKDSAYQDWLKKWQGDTPPPCPEADTGGGVDQP